MRDPQSKNPRQQSVYIHPVLWQAARELAAAKGLSISRWIVSLIERERKKRKP